MSAGRVPIAARPSGPWLVGEGSIRPDERGDPTAGLVVDDALPIAEQLAMNAFGKAGKDAEATLASRINAISKQRWEALEGLKVDIDRVRALLGP